MTVALGCCRIGEDEATPPNGIGIGPEDVGAYAVGQGACLHMRAPDMDDAEVALAGGGDALPLLEKELHGSRIGVVVQHVGLTTDKGIVLRPQGEGCQEAE